MSESVEEFLENTKEVQETEEVKELGHQDSKEDLSTPDNDDQVEPGAEPWVEEDDDGTESGPS